MRRVLMVIGFVCLAQVTQVVPRVVVARAAELPSQQRKKPAAPPAKAVTKTSLDITCPSDLGKGVKSKRTFCDVAIGTDPGAGIVMRVPPHTGTTTVAFDLHNRFAVSGATLPFARASALVAVLNGSNGALIERAAVLGELRTELDLFDRLSGVGPGNSKTVAPGRAQAVKVTVPASVTSISIVGVRLELTNKDGRSEYATAGRPVAIGSNFRIEYTPAVVKK